MPGPHPSIVNTIIRNVNRMTPPPAPPRHVRRSKLTRVSWGAWAIVLSPVLAIGIFATVVTNTTGWPTFVNILRFVGVLP